MEEQKINQPTQAQVSKSAAAGPSLKQQSQQALSNYSNNFNLESKFTPSQNGLHQNARFNEQREDHSPVIARRNAKQIIQQAEAQYLQKGKLYEVRIAFQKSLAKLGNNDTRDIVSMNHKLTFQNQGVNQLHSIIDNNRNQKCLRIYLSLLCQKYKGISPSNKELLVLLFGYLAKTYQLEMIDPLDKQPSIIKTIARVVQAIHYYLKENNELIHHGCAVSLISVYDNCLQSYDDLTTISLIFYEPLASLITSGSDKMAQISASRCILQFMMHLTVEKENKELLNFLFPKFVSLFVKSSFECPDFIATLNHLLETCGVKYLIPYLHDIFKKLIKVLNLTLTNSYPSKIEACKLLGTMAKHLTQVADIVIGYYQKDIVTAIQKALKDRVTKVQQAAAQARQLWKRLQLVHQDLEKKKTTQEQFGDISAEQLIKIRTGAISLSNNIKSQNQYSNDPSLLPHPFKPKKFSILRQLSRAKNRGSSANHTNEQLVPVSDLEQQHKRMHQLKDKGNWGSAARASKFLKKHSGLGGGHIGSLSPPPTGGAKRSKSPKDRQNILSMIKQNIIKLSKQKNGEDVEIFHNLKDIRREIKQQQLRQKQSQEERFSEPVPASQIQNQNAKLHESQPSHLPSPRLEDDPEFPSALRKNISKDNKNIKQYVDEGLNKIQSKMQLLQKKVTTANKNVSMWRNIKAQQQIKNLQSQLQQSGNKTIKEDQELKINHNPDLSQSKPKQSFIHPPISPQLRDSLQIDKQIYQKHSATPSPYKLQSKIFQPVQQLLQNSPFSQQWLKALQEVKLQDYEGAYRRILELNDDIYLLRLAMLTGPVTNRISCQVGRLITLKLNQIVRSDMLTMVMLNWTQAMVGCPQTAATLRKDQMNEVLDTLYYVQGVEQLKNTIAGAVYNSNSGMFGRDSVSERAKWAYDSLKKMNNNSSN